MKRAIKQTVQNERGNQVELLTALGPAEDEVTIELIGPTSTCTNIVTVMEAKALCRMLSALLR